MFAFSMLRATTVCVMRKGMVCAGLLPCLLMLLSVSDRAYGVSVSPAWRVSVAGVPSVLPVGVGRHGRFIVIVENTGGEASRGGGVLHDVLPVGLSAENTGSTGCSGDGSREVECPLPEGLGTGRLVAFYIEFEETGALTPGASLIDVAKAAGGGGVEASA